MSEKTERPRSSLPEAQSGPGKKAAATKKSTVCRQPGGRVENSTEPMLRIGGAQFGLWISACSNAVIEAAVSRSVLRKMLSAYAASAANLAAVSASSDRFTFFLAISRTSPRAGKRTRRA